MLLHLKRFSYSDTETEGVLHVGDQKFATIEQPWLPNPDGAKGGWPFKSCVPDGMYRLLPWMRPDDGDADRAEEEVYILYNPDLGVHRLPKDHPEGHGRDLCLIHKANWAAQVRGCVAPGLQRLPMRRKGDEWATQAVTSSRSAMAAIRAMLGRDGQHILSITNDTGASDVR